MDLNEIVRTRGNTPDQLVGVLRDLQKTKSRNYLCDEDLEAVAEAMKLPESHVYSVATFYSLFSTKPRGKFVIVLCRDVPCHVNGAFDIRDALETLLQINMGETTRDGIFSLEYTSCLGHCELAPVIQIDDRIYGNLNKQKLEQIIADYRRR